MTKVSSEPLSPAMRAALDRFVVPTASADFIDRMAIPSTPKSYDRLLSWSRYARSRRGRWARRASVGIIALGLAGATAAAAFVFDTIRLQIPSVATVLSSAPRVATSPAKIVRRTAALPNDATGPKPPAIVTPVELPLSMAPMGPAMPPIRERSIEVPAAGSALARERTAERAVPRIDGIREHHDVDLVRPVLRAQLLDRAATRRTVMADVGPGGADMGRIRQEALRDRLPVIADHISGVERPSVTLPATAPSIAAPGALAIERAQPPIKPDLAVAQPGEDAVRPRKNAELRQQFREWRARRQSLRRLRNQ